MTLGQISARDDFAKRIAAEKPVYLHECLYPLMQGWDSVEIRADVELGGTEQLFSLLVARDLQQSQGQEPQVALTMPILVGTDGVRRMGKSLGNYIGVGRAARRPVRQGDEHPRRADAAVLHAADRPAAGRGRPPARRPASTRATPRRCSARRSSPSTHGAEAAERAAAEFRRRAAGRGPRRDPRRRRSRADKLDAEGRIAAPAPDRRARAWRSSTSNARRVIEQGGVNVGPDRDGRSPTPRRSVAVERRLDRPGRQAQDRPGPARSDASTSTDPCTHREPTHGQHGFGIVGCGMIAEFHTRAINEIAGRPGRRRVQPDRRPNGAKIAGLAGGDCQVYDDLDAMLAAPRARRRLHLHARAAPTWSRPSRRRRAGKHVVVEKPLEITLAALRRDHRRLRRGRRPALHDLPVAVLAGQPARSRRRSTRAGSAA